MTAGIAALLVFAGATVFNATFDRATAAYLHDDYPTAVHLYEQLVSDGIVEPELFYNLGNAYYRAGRLGPAIANYERALQLEPGFEAAARNLDLSLRKTERRLGKPLPPAWEQGLLFWHYGIGPRTTLALAMVCWLLFWTVLAVRLWRPYRYLRRTAAALGGLALVFFASAWVKAYPTLLAVASEPRVAVHYGIGADETVRFELFEGDRVAVDRRENGWVRVVAAGGERGWVDEAGLTLVGPPYERPKADRPSDGKETS